MGMLDDEPPLAAQHIRLVEVTHPRCNVVAPHGGLFDPLVELGCEVRAGQLAGWIRDPFEIERPPKAVHFEIDGHLAIRCSRGLVQGGEKLFGVVTDVLAD